VTVARGGDLGGAAGGIGADDALQAQLARPLAALVERVDVALHRLDGLERGALHRQQVVVHALEVLADDVQPRMRHQVVHVGDAARDRVLERDHAKLGLAVAHRREGVIEASAQGTVSCPG